MSKLVLNIVICKPRKVTQRTSVAMLKQMLIAKVVAVWCVINIASKDFFPNPCKIARGSMLIRNILFFYYLTSLGCGWIFSDDFIANYL